jgi:hypothetical protein
MDGVVRQIDQLGGIVISCTAVCQCMLTNVNYEKASFNTNGCRKKSCLLSVSNHGDRCLAYPQDTNVFIIDADVMKTKQIPTK